MEGWVHVTVTVTVTRYIACFLGMGRGERVGGCAVLKVCAPYHGYKIKVIHEMSELVLNRYVCRFPDAAFPLLKGTLPM